MELTFKLARLTEHLLLDLLFLGSAFQERLSVVNGVTDLSRETSRLEMGN